MKKLQLLFLCLTMLSVLSCDDDNNIQQVETPATNIFCYGDGTLGFDVIGAIRGETLQIATDAILTPVTILGDGIILNDMDEVEGSGAIIQLDFFGNSTSGFQSGLYDISTLQESGNASGSYSLNFDSTSTTNTFVNLDSGTIRVTPYNNGYLIEINATDNNGEDFHGNYFGIVLLVS